MEQIEHTVGEDDPLAGGARSGDKFGRLLVNQETLEMVKRGDPPEVIEKAIAPKLSDYQKRRASFLLYK